jgi:Sec7-like guanine-nucleotide exchange factor
MAQRSIHSLFKTSTPFLLSSCASLAHRLSFSPYLTPNLCLDRIVSLELILHILEHSGPAFRSGDNFIFAIRQYLCVSLISNCTSQVTQVIGLSLQVFVALLNGFKDHLKAELEIFMTNIFLRILESENSTYEHKCRVLEVFHTICQDPAALVEIFINYDCDFDAIDLFRRMVDSFSKITKVCLSICLSVSALCLSLDPIVLSLFSSHKPT